MDVLPLPASLAAALVRWRSENPDILFPQFNRHCRPAEWIQADLLDMMREQQEHMPMDQREELPEFISDAEGKKIDVHSLRGSYISHLVNAGIHAKITQQLVLHRKIYTTMDIYARVLPENKIKAEPPTHGFPVHYSEYNHLVHNDLQAVFASKRGLQVNLRETNKWFTTGD